MNKTTQQKLIVSVLNKIELTENSINDFSRLSNLLLKACKEGLSKDEVNEVVTFNNKYK